MQVTNFKRPNRTAYIKAVYNDIVLYDAYEGRDTIQANMVRPVDKFWNEYK